MRLDRLGLELEVGAVAPHTEQDDRELARDRYLRLVKPDLLGQSLAEVPSAGATLAIITSSWFASSGNVLCRHWINPGCNSLSVVMRGSRCATLIMSHAAMGSVRIEGWRSNNRSSGSLLPQC